MIEFVKQNSGLIRDIWFRAIEISTFLLVGMVMYRLYNAKRIKRNEKVERQAYTDPLTARGNRHRFLRDMDTHINKDKKFAICFMDLDGFKHINDTFGHDAGDILLIKLSMLLEEHLPDTAIHYRLGGDEFAIIIDKVNTIEDIKLILDKLKQGLTKPIEIATTKIVLEYSMGVSIYPTDAKTRTELMNYADEAMYYIKENGKNDYYFHNEAIKAKIENKNKMELSLREAIEKEQFDISFQPRINLNNIEEITLETFVYWNHPVLGRLNSTYFITQAEEMGLTIQIDEFVARKACTVLESLRSKDYENVKISINLSNTHAKRRDLTDRLITILRDFKLNKGDLLVEFTKRIPYERIGSYKYLLDRLKEVGALVAVSSIGLQYETIKEIRQLNIDIVKAHGGFADDNHFKSDTTLRDVIKVLKDIGYITAVTRIENSEQLQEAIISGSDYVQGNYLYKTIMWDEAEQFLESYSKSQDEIKDLIKRLKK